MDISKDIKAKPNDDMMSVKETPDCPKIPEKTADRFEFYESEKNKENQA